MAHPGKPFRFRFKGEPPIVAPSAPAPEEAQLYCDEQLDPHDAPLSPATPEPRPGLDVASPAALSHSLWDIPADVDVCSIFLSDAFLAA